MTAGTSRLSTWLQSQYPTVFEKYVIGTSPHVRSAMVDGQLVKFYTFREAAAVHIQYVLLCARDCRPFRMGKTPAFQAFLDTLDSSYRVAHRQTCNRLLLALQKVHVQRMTRLFSKLRDERVGRWLNLQLDLWSSGLSKEAYGGLTATFLEEVWLPVHTSFNIDEIRQHISEGSFDFEKQRSRRTDT